MDWPALIGYGLGILGIGTTIYFATRRPPRRLAWEVIRDEILRAPGSGPDGYTFSGKAHHVAIRVMNKGKDPIRREDYDEPVTFISRSLPVSARIGERSSKNLNPVAVVRDGRFSYEPLLLNRGEWFDLEGTFDNSMGGGPLHFVVHKGRIAGINEIENWAERSTRVDRVQRTAGVVAGLLLIAGAIVLLSAAGLAASRWIAVVASWFLSIAGLIVLSLVTGIFRPGRFPHPFHGARSAR